MITNATSGSQKLRKCGRTAFHDFTFSAKGALAVRKLPRKNNGGEADENQPQRPAAQDLVAALQVQVRSGLLREALHGLQLADHGFSHQPNVSHGGCRLVLQIIVRAMPQAVMLGCICGWLVSGDAQGRDTRRDDRSLVLERNGRHLPGHLVPPHP